MQYEPLTQDEEDAFLKMQEEQRKAEEERRRREEEERQRQMQRQQQSSPAMGGMGGMDPSMMSGMMGGGASSPAAGGITGGGAGAAGAGAGGAGASGGSAGASGLASFWPAAVVAAIVGHNEWAKKKDLHTDKDGIAGRALIKDSVYYQEKGNEKLDGLGDEWRLAAQGSSPVDLFKGDTWKTAASLAAKGGIVGKALKKIF